jgi:hypothetical protein
MSPDRHEASPRASGIHSQESYLGLCHSESCFLCSSLTLMPETPGLKVEPFLPVEEQVPKPTHRPGAKWGPGLRNGPSRIDGQGGSEVIRNKQPDKKQL